MKQVVGFDGTLQFDASKPDGSPRKLLDVSRLTELGWQAQTDLENGLNKTYQWFLEHQTSLRGVTT
jgi:GDP-L-fucose synthase